MQDGHPAFIPIQNAGKTIARHVGLGGLTFIISVTAQSPSTAGHIELRYGEQDVFVEISRDICAYKDAVLATLCHEVSHKFLHENRIRHGTTQVEQEFLTDVTAVYLGMGKIMLNGCECQSFSTKTEGGKTITTTHTLRTGYISRECFAFVYRLICEMRQIPSSQFLAGLSEPARQAVSACEQRYRHWFMPQYHLPGGIEDLCTSLRGEIEDSQISLAQRDYISRRVEERVRELSSCIRDSHKSLLEASRMIPRLRELGHNPHLRFLDCLETREGVARLVASSMKQVNDSRKDWDRFADAIGNVPLSEYEIIECPIDQTKLRVPSGRKRLLITCSLCKYKFIVNTGTREETSSPLPLNRDKSGLFQSLKSVFRRR